MKVLIFGATGMIGQAALRECQHDPDVEEVLTVGRNATGQKDAKLSEIVHADLFDLSFVAAKLSGYDACFFCLGVSSFGMDEVRYRRLTYDLTISVAELLATLNPAMTFLYVSGRGTDSTQRGRVMWARIKGETENALMRLPFKAAYMFRPGAVQPKHGVVSKTLIYRAAYAAIGFLLPALRTIAPNLVTASDEMGRAMLKIARNGHAKPILESEDINRV
ncbi:NAD-dependent epimerase/dehydratase family protein [Terrarubrum flagellatum]|uniref:NAD-dependent epimerase/dehydratase family protein n=1 Tax=Terrirubrum flagellatum TaxID=2895980 RepID=UPI003144EEE7